MKTLKKAAVVLLLTLTASVSAFADIFDVKLGAGYICTPWMTTQSLHYNNNTLTKYAIAKTNFVGSYDLMGSATMNLGCFFLNIKGEYSEFKYNATASTGININNIQLSAYCTYSVTGYESIAKYICKEEYLTAGGKVYFGADLIPSFIRVNAGGFAETDIINDLYIKADNMLFEVKSKEDCFSVGLDLNCQLFNFMRVGATLVSWQARNSNANIIGGFTPIQIRNIFYVDGDYDFGPFGIYGGIDYFCDHPEICWNKEDSIDRSNQTYFTIRAGAYIHLH